MSLVPAGLRNSPEFIAGLKADASRGETLLLRHIESGESIPPRVSLPERQRSPLARPHNRAYQGGKRTRRDRTMNVLILGSGAREHALAWACAKSPLIGNLFVAPGNPGCATVAQTVPLSLTDSAKVIAFCRAESIDLVVVGPEGPLVSGLADDLVAAGISCFGPTREAAKLEGSKGYAKDFCREFGIPTGAYRRFREPNEAKAHIRSRWRAHCGQSGRTCRG